MSSYQLATAITIGILGALAIWQVEGGVRRWWGRRNARHVDKDSAAWRARLDAGEQPDYIKKL